MKTTLLIPTLNEIDGMKAIMPKINKDWVDEILIVDAQSTDGTYEYAVENGYKVVRQQSHGVLNSYREALKVATGDVIIPFSPDGNSVAERIPELVAKMKEGYDMVIVSRYLNGAKSEDDDVVTAFGNWMFTKLINLFFGGHYTDTLVMFRAWKRHLIDTCTHDAEPELSIKCAKLKLKVGEIAGDEPARIGGVRKMDPLRNGSIIVGLILRNLFTKA